MGTFPDGDRACPTEPEAPGFEMPSLLSWVILLALARRGDDSLASGFPPPAFLAVLASGLSLRRLPSMRSQVHPLAISW